MRDYKVRSLFQDRLVQKFVDQKLAHGTVPAFEITKYKYFLLRNMELVNPLRLKVVDSNMLRSPEHRGKMERFVVLGDLLERFDPVWQFPTRTLQTVYNMLYSPRKKLTLLDLDQRKVSMKLDALDERAKLDRLTRKN